MTTFDLSSDTSLSGRLVGLVAEGGSRLIVTVEGDRTVPVCDQWGRVVQGETVVPPERFRVLDKPCETCAGTGFSYLCAKTACCKGILLDPSERAELLAERPCTLCVTCDACAGGGREVVEFHTTCPTCSVPQDGRVRLGLELCTRCKPGHWEFCSTCSPPDDDFVIEGTAGSVLVCRATARLLPVIAYGGPRKRSAEHGPHVFIANGGTVHLSNPANKTLDRLTLDPLPRPGVDWGLLLEVVP